MYSLILMGVSSLAALGSAVPTTNNAPACVSSGEAKFDNLKATKPGNGSTTIRVPKGYLGFQWQGFGVYKTPNGFASASPPNVVRVTNGKYGGRMNLPGDRDVDFGIDSFDAACFYPGTKGGPARPANCNFHFNAINGDSYSPQTYTYEASASAPAFQTFSPNADVSWKSFQFIVEASADGETPVLAIDNIVFNSNC